MSREIKDIITAYDAACKTGSKAALATVVQVEGSAYRRPGARMLITDDGRLTGAISGGCLEGDALRKALLVMAQQKAMVVTYDTMDDDDAKLGVGLGCNGIIHILIEPVNAEDENNPIGLMRALLAKRTPGVVITVFSMQRQAHQPGTAFVATKGKTLHNGKAGCIYKQLHEAAEAALANQTSATQYITVDDNEYTAFIEYIQPVVSLIIAGAGNDAMPLMHIAGILGWQVTMADGRPNYATDTRFPQACSILVAKPEAVLAQLTVDAQTAIVLMTHNYNYDLAMLEGLIDTPAGYIGVLGPKKKLLRMFDELQEKGISLTGQQQNKIHGPVGLDIGAETAEEIALSIAAEIKAVFSNGNGKPLHGKHATIHERSHLKPEKI